MTTRCFTFAVLVAAFFTQTTAFADTWPQFRGMTGSGVSSETNLPTSWSNDKGIRWSVELPGRANSAPAITANRIDVTTQDKENGLWVLSFDRKSGKKLRETKVGTGVLQAKGARNLWAFRHNAATPCPAADDDSIYAFFGSGLLVAVDARTGKINWKHDMVKEYGQYDITFGMGSSPRLWGDLLYVECLTKGPSYVVAFDTKTGKEVWKTERTLPAADDGPDAYTSPFVFETKGSRQLLVSGSDHITGYDLSNGDLLWKSAGLEIKSKYGRVIASPAADSGVIVVTSANPGGGGLGHVLGIRAGGEGDVTRSHRAWKVAQSTPDSSTPVCLNGRAFLASDKGVATCLDIQTGEEIWRKRLPTGTIHASLVAGDGKVYFQGIEGTCVVVSADDEGKILSTNKLTGTFYASPAISDGVIYLRSYERLYAIGAK